MKFVTDLTSGIVVDRTGLNSLKTDEMATALSDIYGRGKEVLVVDNVKQFFGDVNLFRSLEGNAPGLTLILEKRGIALDDEQKATLSAFIDLKAYITAQIVATTPPPPPYPFAEVPEGWTLEDNINIGKTVVGRRVGDTGYIIGRKALETIWNAASKKWARGVSGRYERAGSVRAAGYTRNLEVYSDSVNVGCQTIKRFELEQVAVHMDWAIPEVPAKD